MPILFYTTEFMSQGYDLCSVRNCNKIIGENIWRCNKRTYANFEGDFYT